MIGWLLDSVADLSTGWLLVLAFVLPFGETVALLDALVPGEVGMIIIGAAAADHSILPIIAIGSAGAFLGDSTSWYIGHRWGASVLDRWPFIARRFRPLLSTAERHFAARGGWSIFGGRFVGALRAIVPMVAGTAGMSYRRFVPWNLAASVTWVSLIVGLGALFGDPIASFVDRYGIILTATVLAAAATWFLLRRRRQRSSASPSTPPVVQLPERELP